jgi:predicted PurR-regulated permease PerM
MATNPFDASTEPLGVRGEAAPESEPTSSPTPMVPKTNRAQIALLVLSTIAFLYFARPLVLPVFMACFAGMALKPLIRWLAGWHIPPTLSAAIVLCLLVAAIGIGFIQLGRPALTWVNEAP